MWKPSTWVHRIHPKRLNGWTARRILTELEMDMFIKCSRCKESQLGEIVWLMRKRGYRGRSATMNGANMLWLNHRLNHVWVQMSEHPQRNRQVKGILKQKKKKKRKKEKKMYVRMYVCMYTRARALVKLCILSLMSLQIDAKQNNWTAPSITNWSGRYPDQAIECKKQLACLWKIGCSGAVS